MYYQESLLQTFIPINGYNITRYIDSRIQVGNIVQLRDSSGKGGIRTCIFNQALLKSANLFPENIPLSPQTFWLKNLLFSSNSKKHNIKYQLKTFEQSSNVLSEPCGALHSLRLCLFLPYGYYTLSALLENLYLWHQLIQDRQDRIMKPHTQYSFKFN